MATISDVIECMKEMHWTNKTPKHMAEKFYKEIKERLVNLVLEGVKIRLPEYAVYFNPNGQQNKRACKVRAMYNLDTCNRQRIKRCMATQRLAGDGLTKDVTVKYMKALMSKYHLEHKDECKELSDDYYEV